MRDSQAANFIGRKIRPETYLLRGVPLIRCGFRAGDEHTAIDRLNGAGLRRVQGGSDLMNMGSNHRPIDGRHDQHRKRAPFEALLIFHIFVARQEDIKAFALNQRE